MNPPLLLFDDEESEKSFDSSEFCSIGERTASIDSNAPNNKLQAILMTPNIKTRSIDETLSEKTASIEKPRIQELSENKSFEQENPFQLGFVMGKNKKNIAFNESKIKKAQNFFDEEDLTFHEDPFQTNSLFEFPKKEDSKLLNENSIMREISNPCFQNFGKKQKVEINQNLLEKAKNFFNDDIEENTISMPSFKKPTKVKKPVNETEKEADLIKTANANKNKKKLEANKVLKKEVFDWNNFFLNIENPIEKSTRKSSCKKSSNLKSKQKNKSKTIFQSIKLKDLSTEEFQNEEKITNFTNKIEEVNSLTFNHLKTDCRVPKCLLCDININEVKINREKLEDIFSNKLIREKIDTEIFAKLYEQIYFKLLKYDNFYPMLVNKRLNPSNILVEMHKKSKLIETGNPCLGWIDFCLKENKFYHSFIAEVKEIYHNEKIQTFFIKLSDGWSNVWAVITEKNELYHFKHKFKIFSKIFIGYWKNYALGNILSFCPLTKEKEKCIEIWYNSSILVKENSKIGKPKGLIFYRPLNKNRKEGGLIPTVEGVILRMFCCCSQSKKKSCYSGMEQSFNENYVEIITSEGYCVLIKFILSSERSLAELFRLYYRYQFYFLKIGAKDNILQFNDGVSKFFELEKKDKKQYDHELVKVIKKRYINSMKDMNLEKILKVGELYDIFMEGNESIVNEAKFVIDNNYENETITNSYFKAGSCLYQQYELDKIDKIKNSTNETFKLPTFILKKVKFSNTLKTLPATYKEINQLNDL